MYPDNIMEKVVVLVLFCLIFCGCEKSNSINALRTPPHGHTKYHSSDSTVDMYNGLSTKVYLNEKADSNRELIALMKYFRDNDGDCCCEIPPMIDFINNHEDISSCVAHLYLTKYPNLNNKKKIAVLQTLITSKLEKTSWMITYAEDLLFDLESMPKEESIKKINYYTKRMPVYKKHDQELKASSLESEFFKGEGWAGKVKKIEVYSYEATAMFKIAGAYQELKDYDSALKTYADIISKFNNNEFYKTSAEYYMNRIKNKKIN